MGGKGGIAGIMGVIFMTAFIFATPMFPAEETVTRLTEVTYTYEQKLEYENQVDQIPWFWNQVTQTQHIITNTYTKDGTFTLNYRFDNGSETKTKTNKVKFLAGETISCTMRSPLSGTSNVTLNVIPPMRVVPVQETISKNASLLEIIGDSGIKISIFGSPW